MFADILLYLVRPNGSTIHLGSCYAGIGRKKEVSIHETVTVGTGIHALRCEYRTLGSKASVTASYNTMIPSFTPTYKRHMMGADGFVNVFNGSNLLHSVIKDGKHNLTIRGDKIDMPGVLISGRVDSDGKYEKQRGCKAITGMDRTLGSGRYKISHNIGHTKYTVVGNPIISSLNATSTAHLNVANMTNEYFEIVISDSSSGTKFDCDFTYCVTGTN